jgi:RNA polymerase sigma-70 factor (ECF subfamily)
MSAMQVAELAEAYHTFRPLLFSIAYRMTGSALEAEDLLQDGFLRLHAAASSKGGEPIQSPRAYLSTLITRLSLDHLKKVKGERARYDGPWLPEPILTGAGAAIPEATDPAELSERREAISLAFLMLLESLSPEERAVFLLHEVFDYPHEEVATMIGKSPAACRQLLRRARARLAAARTDGQAGAPDQAPRRRPRRDAATAEHHRLVTRFLHAVERGDVQALAQSLAQDVVHLSDGGGKVFASRRPITGRDAVLRFLAGLLRLAPADTRFTTAELNGAPALLVWVGDQLFQVTIFEVEDGLIRRTYSVVNPEKLAYLRRQLQEITPALG